METREFDPRFSAMNHQKDLELLRRAIVLSQEARDAGNTPFGALLADSDGNIIMEQGNQELTSHDCTMHAETGLMRRASQAFTKEVLWDCSLYTSAEPCCMCAGAIYWGNVGRIVYAMSEKMLLAATGDNEVNPTFDLNCREVLSKGQKPIVVQGPYEELKEEALKAHQGFWD